jgi:WhiB family redox-sensing transcriptional regulator
MNTTDERRVVDLPLIEWTPQPWREQAACKGKPLDIFFSANWVEVNAAKAVCESCPVRFECLMWACDHEVKHGVFGGLSSRERGHHMKGVTNWAVCGTKAGIDAHVAAGEPLCAGCSSAMQDNKQRSEKRKKYDAKYRDKAKEEG